MDFMSASGGTDLASAYSQPDMLSSSPSVAPQQSVEPIQYSAEIPPSTQGQRQGQHQGQHQGQRQSQSQSSEQPSEYQPTYNQSELLQDINTKTLKSQMELLRKEMEDQKNATQLQYKENFERNSMYDRFVKRRKDVSRFICLALIIVFALSTHDIISNALSEYINSINITPRRELGMKLTYPIGVLALYWSMKAFKV